MCTVLINPTYIDSLLRLLLSLFLFGCCIILSMIFSKKKAWDEAFWVCFSGFVICLAGYGYTVHQIYLANTLSYDGFVAVSGILVVIGLLFAKRKYVPFSDKMLCKNTPILVATFVVFSLIYLSTVNYGFGCVANKYELSVKILEIVIYPLLLLFAIVTFLYRFAICLSVFAVCMALFLIENVFFIFYEWLVVTEYNILVEEVGCAVVSILISMMAIYILTRAKRIYKEKKNGSNRN